MTRSQRIIRDEGKYYAPVYRRLPLVMERGRGSIVFDVEGRNYLDLTAGWGVTCLGHAHPAITKALRDQAGKMIQAPNSNLSYTFVQTELAKFLVTRVLPRGMARVFLTNSGTEAMEAAIKLAWRATGRKKIVSTLGSFHGRTIGALSATGQDKHRKPFEPLLPQHEFVPYGDLRAMERAARKGAAAILVEPLQGEGGVNVPPPGYLRGLRRIARKAGALLILDEIQTGFGRTGRMFGCEHEGVVPDVMTLGKGLGGGFPIGAVAATEAVWSTAKPGDHGGTYVGNPLACAAALAVVRTLKAERLDRRAARLGERAMEKLRDLGRRWPDLVREVRGKGLLIGVELASEDAAAAVIRQGIRRGILYNQCHGRVIRIFPALNIEERLLDRGIRTLGSILAGLGE